jgi:hypothetical protein
VEAEHQLCQGWLVLRLLSLHRLGSGDGAADLDSPAFAGVRARLAGTRPPPAEAAGSRVGHPNAPCTPPPSAMWMCLDGGQALPDQAAASPSSSSCRPQQFSPPPASRSISLLLLLQAVAQAVSGLARQLELACRRLQERVSWDGAPCLPRTELPSWVVELQHACRVLGAAKQGSAMALSACLHAAFRPKRMSASHPDILPCHLQVLEKLNCTHLDLTRRVDRCAGT